MENSTKSRRIINETVPKVDFIWVNRDQTSFEWFVNLLSQLEAEQISHETNDKDGNKMDR